MTITISRKSITAGAIAIIVIVLGIFIYQKYSISRYEKAAKEMKINTSVNIALLGEVLNDIHDAWNTGIEGGSIQNADGEDIYVHDMTEAVQIRLAYWKSKGIYDIIDSLAKETSDDMEIMSNTPSKYKDIQKAFTEIYNNTNELISLSKVPQYSLVAFSQKINDLSMNVNSKIKETDLLIKVTDDEIQKKGLSVAGALQNKEKDKWASHIKKQKYFLTQNAKKPGVVTLSNGLQYKIIKKGNGKIPNEISKVRVHYEGKTIDGNIFDSSYQRGEPAEFYVNLVIRGFTEALTRMPCGSIWEIYVPENLGYGNKKAGAIEPYSTLIFKIELINIVN
jgi:FKBP-type peptidyl-prolyl cis-trans isomerase